MSRRYSYQFPREERFRKIAACLADAVMHRFRQVSASNKVWCFCPMGCVGADVDSAVLRPTGIPSRLRRLGLRREEFLLFIEAFDIGSSRSPAVAHEPFWHLGLAYRERFP